MHEAGDSKPRTLPAALVVKLEEVGRREAAVGGAGPRAVSPEGGCDQLGVTRVGER